LDNSEQLFIENTTVGINSWQFILTPIANN